MNLISSRSSSQTCQIVKDYLQSYYICHVLKLPCDSDIYPCTGSDGVNSRECISEVIIARTTVLCQADSKKESQSHLPRFMLTLTAGGKRPCTAQFTVSQSRFLQVIRNGPSILFDVAAEGTMKKILHFFQCSTLVKQNQKQVY